MKTYKERIMYLISRLYEPADTKNYDVKMTTGQIYSDLCTIIPAKAFDEFDVVDALQELKFEVLYETKVIEIENELGIKEKKVYDDLSYYWYLKKKEH